MTAMNEITGPSCRHMRSLLGVYVVGAIDPADRALVDSHLADCPQCREELSGLAGLPALLGRVPLLEAEALADSDQPAADWDEPSPELLNGLLERVSSRRRSRRWRSVLALAAAVAIAAGGTAAGVSALRPGGPAAEQVQASNGEVTAQVRYVATPWGGTTMRIAVIGIPRSTVCRFWVVDAAGQRTAAGAWTTGPGYGERWYTESSKVASNGVRGFQITAHGRTLLSIPAT
jgi:hypothetical protein